MKSYLALLPALFLYSCQSTTSNNESQDSDGTAGALYTAVDIDHHLGEVTSGLEGPAVDANGNLYFVNALKSRSIGMFDKAGNFNMFIDQLPEGSTGNGIRFGKLGEMYIADYTGHNVLRVDMATKSVMVYAHYDSLNQPNDIAITSSNILFASDPDWKNQTGQIWKVNQEGQFDLLETGMGTTNGIEVSPDEKTLYVNESVQRNIWAYDLSENGDISNKRQFAKVEDHGMDGMRCDVKGNLYTTRWGKGTVLILRPDGTKKAEVTLKGKKPSNIAFGGADGKTCYVTVQDRGYIETFRSEFAGREFGMWSDL